ncbi:hypothetical protein MUO74_10735 [Candidatus Bathyarchaeota archaeon]|nr:hypothetical protein [Candidatus Bathyarchaeota archaeon]
MTNSTIPNSEKKLGKHVVTFLEFVFEKELDRKCASAILKNLPLPKANGSQAELIETLTPKYPPHYWHALKKLKSMGIIKIDSERIEDRSRKASISELMFSIQILLDYWKKWRMVSTI